MRLSRGAAFGLRFQQEAVLARLLTRMYRPTRYIAVWRLMTTHMSNERLTKLPQLKVEAEDGKRIVL